MAHVRRGDLVVVTKGKDKGKRGKVLRVVSTKSGERVIVEKVNLVKRHTKANQKNPQGGILEKEGTIAIANVALWDEKLGKATRTRWVEEGGTKVRVGVKSGTRFEAAGL
ncbi:MAG TPA: 50S ribosomal protein L24 [Kofleriaceae bacterium]|nr:50S ribosomal protein L24 [Kofleriaceae bacterium]